MQQQLRGSWKEADGVCQPMGQTNKIKSKGKGKGKLMPQRKASHDQMASDLIAKL